MVARLFRVFRLIVLIVTLIGASNGFACLRITDTHNIDQCDMTRANIPLLQTNIYEPAKFLATVKRTVTYPETISDTKYVISCIKVTNLDTSDTGGYARLLSGGIGSYDAQILLISQWGQSLNFRIEIWADV